MFENSHGKIDLGEAVHDLCYSGLTLKEEQQCSWSILRGCTFSLQHLFEEKSLIFLCQCAAKPNYTRNAYVNGSPQRLHLENKFLGVLLLL